MSTDYPKALAAAREALKKLREHDGGTRHSGHDDFDERSCCLVADWKPHDSDCPHAVAVAKFDHLIAALDAQVPLLTVCLRGERYGHDHMQEIQVQVEPGVEIPQGAKLYLAPVAPAASVPAFDDYDAGLLGDYGGGNVEWWHDYIRAEIGRANDFWRTQAHQPTPPPAGLAVVPEGWEIKRIPGDLRTIAVERADSGNGSWITPEHPIYPFLEAMLAAELVERKGE